MESSLRVKLFKNNWNSLWHIFLKKTKVLKKIELPVPWPIPVFIH